MKRYVKVLDGRNTEVLHLSSVGEATALENFEESLIIKARESESGRDRTRLLKYKEYMTTTSAAGKHSWFGVEGGVPEVKRVVHEGWLEGVAKATRVVKKVELPSIPTYRRTKSWGQMGMSLNYNKVLVGSAKPWRKMVRREGTHTSKSGGNVTVVIDFMSSGNVSQDSHIWRSVVGMRLAEALVKSGRRVRVVAIGVTKHSLCNSDYVFMVTLKKYEEALSLNDIVTPTGLAGFLRVYEFASNFLTEHINNLGVGDAGKVKDQHIELLADDSTTLVVENVSGEESAKKVLTNLVKGF